MNTVNRLTDMARKPTAILFYRSCLKSPDRIAPVGESRRVFHILNCCYKCINHSITFNFFWSLLSSSSMVILIENIKIGTAFFGFLFIAFFQSQTRPQKPFEFFEEDLFYLFLMRYTSRVEYPSMNVSK